MYYQHGVRSQATTLLTFTLCFLSSNGSNKNNYITKTEVMPWQHTNKTLQSTKKINIGKNEIIFDTLKFSIYKEHQKVTHTSTY